jgi:hypothetical protein
MKFKLLITFTITTIFLMTGCGKKEVAPVTEKATPSFEIQTGVKIPSTDSLDIFELVRKQVEFGPRVSGTSAWEATKKFLSDKLVNAGAVVKHQDFEARVPAGQTLKFTNIIGSFNPDAEKRIQFYAHWDSRPHADQEADTGKHKIAIPGANDGASGTAVLLALAEVLGKNNLNFGVDIVLFDAEDYGSSGSIEGYCLGSKYYAANYPLQYKPRFGILLDLVGDKEAIYMREEGSVRFAFDVVDQLWKYAQSQGNNRFKDFVSQPIYDDHIPLNEVGIKTINIIDAGLVGADSKDPRRNYWHTLKDDMSNISRTTLSDLTRVLTGFIYSLKLN